MLLLGGALLAGAVGSAVGGRMSAQAAERQAKSQKAAMTRYARALQQQASKIQGGMSPARMRSLQAAGAIQRAAESQQARRAATRGDRVPSAELEVMLAEAQQSAAVGQQQALDATSSQLARQKDLERRNLQLQGLQAQSQAQAIDPQAAKRAVQASTVQQVVSGVATPLASLGTEVVQPQVQALGLGRAAANLSKKTGVSTSEALGTIRAMYGSGD